MKIRATYKPLIAVITITLLALCGIFLTHCKKFEVSAEVIVKIEEIWKEAEMLSYLEIIFS